MKEDKVREAIELLETGLVSRPMIIRRATLLLKEAIAPEQPEIPEGCPVIWSCEDWDEPQRGHYSKFYHEDRSVEVEIDYQRKGHVIPWSGGDIQAITGSASLGECDVWLRCGWHGCISDAPSFDWEWNRRGEYTTYDIIAYVIWPERVK